MNSVNQILTVNLKDSKRRKRSFSLSDPVSVSRKIVFGPEEASSNAFNLPRPSKRTVEIPGIFVGDMDRGGPCNVEVYSLCPHGVTHIETSAHVTKQSVIAHSILDLSPKFLQGLTYLVDLSDVDRFEKNFIVWDNIKDQLEQVDLPITMLALKTQASLLPEDYNYSEKNFVSIDYKMAEKLRLYSRTMFSERLHTLLLDLPSADPEHDGGSLRAHKEFFAVGNHDSQKQYDSLFPRAIVELAYFGGLSEGYYYCVMTPVQMQIDAIATGILFYPLVES